jgi:hypothetical protein
MLAISRVDLLDLTLHGEFAGLVEPAEPAEATDNEG